MDFRYGEKVKVSLGKKLYIGTYVGIVSTCPFSSDYRKVIVRESRTDKRMIVSPKNVEKY